MLSINALIRTSRLSRPVGFPRLVLTRINGNFSRLRPQWELPLRQRLKLLIGPTVFAGSVGIGTYAIAEAKQSSIHEQKGHVTLPGDIKIDFVTAIVGANILVFALWNTKSPAVLAILNKYMVSNFYSPTRTLSMLGAIFSHKSLVHLVINMYVLSSFTRGPADPYKTAHIYLTGGLVGSLGSYLRAALNPKFRSVSLGASGAILSLIGYTIGKYPESRFSVVLVDQIYPHSFSAQTALWIIAGFDTCGLIFGWRIFDHACHLGGLLFGWLKSN